MNPLSALSNAVFRELSGSKTLTFAAAIAFLLLGASLAGASKNPADPGRLHIGWAKADLTPEGPVAMRGGVVSTGVMDPLSATALALSSGPGDSQSGIVLVSCDLLFIQDGGRSSTDLLGEVRERATARPGLGDLRPEQIVLMATHTHVAPSVRAGDEVFDFLAGRIADAVAEAWSARQPGGVSYGLGHAVVGHQRIASYGDGSSRMAGSMQRGSTKDPDFTHLEGFEDHSVHLLYTWDEEGELTGVVANVACPAQVHRGDRLSADYWHEVREELSQRLGPEVHLLPQLSAAGDIANIVMVEREGEARMQRLMYPELSDPRLLRRKQIAMRVADAVTSVLPFMHEVAETHPVLAHRVAEVALPGGFPEPQEGVPDFPVELHAVRLGEIAMVTNPFELYLDYGIRIKGRSPATQTFVIQLAGGGSYLPTARAVAGGAYGAIPQTSIVGPAAGARLVEATLEMIADLWEP